MYSKRELLNWLWELGDGSEHPPSQATLNQHDDAPSAGTYHRRFSSWQQALLDAGFSESVVSERYPDASSAGVVYSDEELLETVREIADKLGRTPTREEFDTRADASVTTVSDRFVNWTTAVKRAGLEPVKQHSEEDHYTDGELLEIIRQVADEIDEKPSVSQIRSYDWTPSTSTYQRRFGSWSESVELAFENR
jgi:hypothetical protein